MQHRVARCRSSFPSARNIRKPRIIRHGSITPYNRLLIFVQHYLQKFRKTINKLLRKDRSIPTRIAADENIMYLAMVVHHIFELPKHNYKSLLHYLVEERPVLRERRRRFFSLLRETY